MIKILSVMNLSFFEWDATTLLYCCVGLWVRDSRLVKWMSTESSRELPNNIFEENGRQFNFVLSLPPKFTNIVWSKTIHESYTVWEFNLFDVKREKQPREQSIVFITIKNDLVEDLKERVVRQTKLLLYKNKKNTSSRFSEVRFESQGLSCIWFAPTSFLEFWFCSTFLTCRTFPVHLHVSRVTFYI
jgi:hypothetical protein